ncbi:MAG: alpha amylase N-terminal ig-like domain-containing protein [Candidatus Coproplasma sp.]
MNESAILHYPESKYCYATGANTVCLRLRISRKDIPDKVKVIYGGKYSFATERKEAVMNRSYEDRLYAYYTMTLSLEDLRLVYVFEICDKGKRYFYSEDGLTKKYDFELSYYNCFQYAYINQADVMKRVGWMDTACFYQIFVERFNVGNREKDLSYVNMEWGGKPTPKSFAGGDLQGIYQKLEYLKDLGINAVYLTPIFKSVSNHKYDISDYYSIDTAFGDKEVFRSLVDKAHSLGMKIVMDAVFNHCSENLWQFQDVLKNGKESPYYDWFVITSDNPLKYECFAACKYMPKFNTSNLEVQKFLLEVAVYWIKEFKIDGWRLDVSDEVSHDFWRVFRKTVKEANADCVLIGENWHDANAYLHGDEFDGIMNYAFTKACLDFYAFGKFSPKQMADKLNEILMRNTDTVNLMMLNLLDSHDTDRFLTRVKGNEDKLISAIALNFFFVGTPCIYYGTEIGLEGGYDPDNRRCMDWDKAEEDTPLKRLIKTLSAIKSQGGLSGAEIKIYEENGLLILRRERYVLAINQSGKGRIYAADNAVCSNKYAGQILSEGGFVLHKIMVKEG